VKECLNTSALVRIHQTQFPRHVRRELLKALHYREINPKFHYETIKQAAKWLQLHQTYSPSQTDKDCDATYHRAFKTTASEISTRSSDCAGRQIHLIGLGCGHGEKETKLLRLLHRGRIKPWFTPVDVSVPLLLRAREAALPFLGDADCAGLVCELQIAFDLPRVLDEMTDHRRPRLYTLFGVIPNSEPRRIFRQLGTLIRPGDWLLLSVNLAPGDDYQRGVEKVLPGYDNSRTRDWLLTFLLDLGVERGDGAIQFFIEPARSGLKRIVADFHFSKKRTVEVEDHMFEFRPGQSIRLFFSYRYTASLIESRLNRQGLRVLEQWITKSGEEGVFLCRSK
jgi:uncharacterized SAM-dependent methyltransferase